MKKALLMLALMSATLAWAQDDDMYFVPSKKKAKVEEKREVQYVSRPVTVTTTTTTVTRDVDEYNRRGGGYSQPSSVDYDYQMNGDTLYLESTKKVQESLSAYQDGYSDGYYDGADDMAFSRRLLRYRRPGLVWYDDFYWDTWYDPWFHSPYYYNRWYYDSWGWSFGWNYGWGGYLSWHYPYWGWHTPHYGGWHPHPNHGIGNKPWNGGVAVRNGSGWRPSAGRVGGAVSRNGRTMAARSSSRDYGTREVNTNNSRSSQRASTSSRTQRNSSASSTPSNTRTQRSSVNTTQSSPSRVSTPSRSSGGSFGGNSGGGFGGGSRGGGGGSRGGGRGGR